MQNNCKETQNNLQERERERDAKRPIKSHKTTSKRCKSTTKRQSLGTWLWDHEPNYCSSARQCSVPATSEGNILKCMRYITVTVLILRTKNIMI